MGKKINVYIGWDSREVDAYNVCKKSLEDASTVDINIIPLKKEELKNKKLYYRDTDPLATTEFTYSRFLVPHLNNYEGVAIFCDCDFLWLTDIKLMLESVDYNTPSFKDKAVYVCQHNYTPSNTVKMDNKPQATYPRKNWSSLILWNCEHEQNKALTVSKVNSETGAYLHRFSWLNDSVIGSLSLQWNWLVDVYNEQEYGKPFALHYTNGGPWFENYKNCSYAHLWNDVFKKQ